MGKRLTYYKRCHQNDLSWTVRDKNQTCAVLHNNVLKLDTSINLRTERVIQLMSENLKPVFVLFKMTPSNQYLKALRKVLYVCKTSVIPLLDVH